MQEFYWYFCDIKKYPHEKYRYFKVIFISLEPKLHFYKLQAKYENNIKNKELRWTNKLQISKILQQNENLINLFLVFSC